MRRKRLSSEKMNLRVTILKNYISQFSPKPRKLVLQKFDCLLSSELNQVTQKLIFQGRSFQSNNGKIPLCLYMRGGRLNWVRLCSWLCQEPITLLVVYVYIVLKPETTKRNHRSETIETKRPKRAKMKKVIKHGHDLCHVGRPVTLLLPSFKP